MTATHPGSPSTASGRVRRRWDGTATPSTSSGSAGVCFFLDRILFPGLRDVEVREPIFMVGHARSGTTLTHRLLSKDTDRFSSFLLYELYFPSLLQKKLIRAGARLDARLLGGFLERRVRAWEERLLVDQDGFCEACRQKAGVSLI